MVGLSTFFAGVTAYLIGHLKLGFIVRYVPSQVTAGFLAASGVLLIREAFTILVPDASAQTLPGVALLWPQWLPWLLLGAALSIMVRRHGSGLMVPLAFSLAALVFYCALPVLGFDFNVARSRSRGWLLGPFQPDSLLHNPSVALLQNVQWQALPALGLGLLVVCLLFVFVYAQIGVVRLFTTAAHLRARVERSAHERERVVSAGRAESGRGQFLAKR